MASIIILLFILGYTAIAFEHPLGVDKTVPAIIMGALMWALLSIGFHNGWLNIIDGHEHLWSMAGGHSEEANEGFVAVLVHHIGKTSEILIFLIGAMTIVEIIDLHRGFSVIKGWIKTTNKKTLLWIITGLAFFLSAVIDNLTATIVLVTLLRKLIHKKEERIWFAALIVIAANAGGAWSPIGDVTTTMLWIGNKTTAGHLITRLIIPSLISIALPVFIAGFLPPFKGKISIDTEIDESAQRLLSSKKMLFLGLGAIISVPVFKTVTHLPPYLGMMLGLGIVWLVSEYIHPEENFDKERRHLYSAHKALSRIEMSSILFFLGILMAVASLETLAIGHLGTLRYAAEALQHAIPNQDFVIILLGVFSSIIDNVPLVAATMGMYNHPIDDYIWHFIAYAAGTGGSMLIIGSAAGVAAMGMEKIDFIWYFKKITWIAVAGYLAGAGIFILMESLG